MVIEVEVILEVNLKAIERESIAKAWHQRHTVLESCGLNIRHRCTAHLELAVPPAVLQQLRLQVLDLRLELLDLCLAQRMQLQLHGLELILYHDGSGGLRRGSAILRVVHDCSRWMQETTRAEVALYEGELRQNG